LTATIDSKENRDVTLGDIPKSEVNQTARESITIKYKDLWLTCYASLIQNNIHYMLCVKMAKFLFYEEVLQVFYKAALLFNKA
jgi:hypothetical protein